MKKVILITGAGSGIGRDAAYALMRRGHKVIASTHTDEQAQALKKGIDRWGLGMEVIKLDITLESDREKIRDYDLDVLINNAGIGESGSLAEIPMDRLRQNFEVNVFSTIALTQIALQRMIEKNNGTVLVVSSIAGRIPSAFISPYSMTKFALSGGIAALREEVGRVAPRVHVSLIEPGAYATGFNERMLAKKYEWMGERSYFYKLIPALKKEDDSWFERLEVNSTASIVRKIVQASESSHPHLRYVAPFYQGLGVALMRIFGV